MISDEAIREFLVESYEGLDALDRELLALEANPHALDRIAVIFRTIHTIKGSSGFLGYSQLESITHAGESLLVLLRDGSLVLTPEITSALLTLVDRVRGLLSAVEADGREREGSHADLLELFARLRESPANPPRDVSISLTAPAQARAAPVHAPAAPVHAPPVSSTTADDRGPAQVAVTQAATQAAAEPSGAAITDSNVRIDVAILDNLMNLVGELVLARNQVLQLGLRLADPSFANVGQRLSFITSELQEQVMRTRMQPIGNAWGKLPRVVRDLAITCGKQVRVEMQGKDTELDRTILEAIKDPLVHIVRNAVDHGLEMPDLRHERGKPRTGTLRLRAYHQAGQVNIEISDDGGGVNVERVKQKALDRQLITEAQAEQMSDHEFSQLVFLPGFSTAPQVTNLSGRGVGMDVVKTNIERIGGDVELTSRSGLGTTLRIRIPLTLAIVPALLIETLGQRFAIPQANLLEVVRLDGEQALRRIENLHGVSVYRLRGNLLPLVHLDQTLQMVRENATVDGGLHIIILQTDETRFGLIVDSILDTEEIVVKPMGKELKSLSVFAGTTILGDGRVALILDIAGLAQHSGATGKTHVNVRSISSATIDAVETDAKQSLLLFNTERPGVMALPLSIISRLEEFDAGEFERIGDMSVVQYRDEVMPLIEPFATPGTIFEKTGSIPVIVYEEEGRRVGVLVRQVLDVVEEAVRVNGGRTQPGILGTAIIQGRVTEIIDLHRLIEAQMPWFFADRAA